MIGIDNQTALITLVERTSRFTLIYRLGIRHDSEHLGHAVIEQVNTDLKSSVLAHLPSGIFTADAAWLVLAVMAFNLTRAAATPRGAGLAKATTATIGRKLFTVPARIASSARRIVIHLPTAWPWEDAWTDLFNRVNDPPDPVAA